MSNFFKYLSLLIVTLIFNCFFQVDNLTASESKPTIVQIESLGQISDQQPQNTIYFFDIDDTLIDSPYMLGSKAWRKYISQATKSDTSQNWHDIFTLALAEVHPTASVESITSEFVKNLQNKGYSVLGLTARERHKWYDTAVSYVDILTEIQLYKAGIILYNDKLNTSYEKNPEYYNGVFFVNTDSKGDYVLKLFQNIAHRPEKVVFVDDKLSNVESVAEALDTLGIDHECYWYTATNKKSESFAPLIANIQLYYFWTSEGIKVLSDAEAALIAEQNPELDSDNYLEATLENARELTYVFD